MKLLPFKIVFLLFVFSSCKKGVPLTPSNPALRYVGFYYVFENATSYTGGFTGGYNGLAGFYGKILPGDSISKIKFDQSSKYSLPYWRLPPYTIIDYRVDGIKLIGRDNDTGRIYKPDSLTITYRAGNCCVYYIVKQTWIRRGLPH